MGFGHSEAGFKQGAARQCAPALSILGRQLLDERDAAGRFQRA